MDKNHLFAKNVILNEKVEGTLRCSAPSNIALVKYWGKYPVQLPANPSISFTLDHSKTITELKFTKKKVKNREFNFEFLFEGKSKPTFLPKLKIFFQRIEPYFDFLTDYTFVINSENTFPHSSGIASSASSMSALSYCLVKLEAELCGINDEKYIINKTSFIARLGSGSACRSVSGPLMVWGNHPKIENSSDCFAIAFPYQAHKVFEQYQDTILLVEHGKKEVSSSVGHDLMHDHPFSKQRFDQAFENLTVLKKVLVTGDIKKFIAIVESEALTLHAMMMTSMPYFILMKPNTLQIIQKVWEYRRNHTSSLCFTLDAGANVHLLYPKTEKDHIKKFIDSELVAYCENEKYICDQIGFGVKLL